MSHVYNKGVIDPTDDSPLTNKTCRVNVSPYHFFYAFCLPLWTEAAYDLLPRELQLLSSTQLNPKVMSQKSGGEAGPPPSAAIASGRILLLLSYFLFIILHASTQKKKKKKLCQ